MLGTEWEFQTLQKTLGVLRHHCLALAPPDSEGVRLSLEACEKTQLEYGLEFKDVVLPLEVCEATELDDNDAVLDVFAAIAGPITDFTLEPNGI